MRTPKKLNIEQQKLLALLEKEYNSFNKSVVRVAKLFYEAGKLKIPTPQVAKKLGITRNAVSLRYKKLPH